ncbi:MAG: hypothetical protein U0990_12620 [Candidatus Nanopelagicales bacterium]|nr:hypothetical protein [Candidatus Nanopelagicales bacterium]
MTTDVSTLELPTEAVAETSTETQAATEDADIDSFIQELDGSASTEGEQGQEEDGEGTEGDEEAEAHKAQRDADREVIRAEERKAIEAETARKEADRIRKAEDDGVELSFRQRIARLEATLVQQGFDPNEGVGKVLADQFKAHHGQAQQVIGAQFWDGIEGALETKVSEDAAKAFKEKRTNRLPKDAAEVDTWLDAMFEAVREDERKSEAVTKNLDAAKATAKRDTIRDLLKNPAKLASLNSRARGIPESLGGHSMPRGDERALLVDPKTPISVVKAIRDRQRANS